MRISSVSNNVVGSISLANSNALPSPTHRIVRLGAMGFAKFAKVCRGKGFLPDGDDGKHGKTK